VSLSYFDELVLETPEFFGEHFVDEEEMITFARRWDPQGIHVDKTIAEPLFGDVIASAAYTMAVATLLLNQRPKKLALIAGLGSEGFELPNPVLPGDRIQNQIEWTNLIPSATKTDRGIAYLKQTLSNQDGGIVFLTKGKLMISRKTDL